MAEQVIFKVGKETKVGKLAEAIRRESEKNRVAIQCIGKDCCWIAVKALSLAQKGCCPTMVEVENENGKVMVLNFEVVAL